MTLKTFSFDDDEKIVREVSKIKGKKGEIYRFGFPLFPGVREKGENFSLDNLTPQDPEDERSCQKLSPIFVAHKCAWVEGVGNVFCDEVEIEQFVQSLGGKVRMRVGTVVASYPLDDDGNVNFKKMMEDPSSVNIQSFIIDLGKYKKLKEKHMDYYLWRNDLKCSLEPDKAETFQAWTFDIPKPKQAFSVVRKLLENKAEGETKVVALIDDILRRTVYVAENELEQCMGKKVSLATLKQKIQGGPAPAEPVEVSADEDVENTLANLGL